MAAEVNWTKQALDDLTNIATYIAKDSHHYAIIQTEKFFQRATILEKQPQIGQIVPEIGDPLIRKFIECNYRIIYTVISLKRIDILTIYHKSRLLASNPLFKG